MGRRKAALLAAIGLAVLSVLLLAARPTPGSEAVGTPRPIPGAASIGRETHDASVASRPRHAGVPTSIDRAASRLRDATRALASPSFQRRSVADIERESASEPTEPSSFAATTGLRNRMVGHRSLVEALNADFLPLAHECISQAEAREVPPAPGMLAIHVSVAAEADDADGTVITVEPSERNEVHDAPLLECIRETALSTELPAPNGDESDAFMLTLPVGE